MFVCLQGTPVFSCFLFPILSGTVWKPIIGVRHIIEAALYSKWSSIQLSTKGFNSRTIPCTGVVWYQLLHYKPQQNVTWKVFKYRNNLLKILSITEFTDPPINNRIFLVGLTVPTKQTLLLDTLFCTTGLHLMRVQSQATMWRNTYCATHELSSPLTMGRKNYDSGPQSILMSLSTMPESHFEIISCVCRKQCQNAVLQLQ